MTNFIQSKKNSVFTIKEKQENIVNLEIFVCSQTILLSVCPIKKPRETQLQGIDIKLIKIILARTVVHQKKRSEHPSTL